MRAELTSTQSSGVSMHRTLGHVTLLVRDYDEAIAFFTGCLGFNVVEDTPLGDGKRWVLVGPSDDSGTSLLLAHASTPEQIARGGQTGRRPGVPVSVHARLRPGPRPNDGFRREVPRSPKGRGLRHRGGLRGPVRKHVGSPAAASRTETLGFPPGSRRVRPANCAPPTTSRQDRPANDRRRDLRRGLRRDPGKDIRGESRSRTYGGDLRRPFGGLRPTRWAGIFVTLVLRTRWA